MNNQNHIWLALIMLVIFVWIMGHVHWSKIVELEYKMIELENTPIDIPDADLIYKLQSRVYNLTR